MKNKLLVSVFAVGLAAFALTSCETKSDVTGVCSDMVKESMHKTPRSLVQLDGEVLTIEEYEFLGGVNDNRLLYRTIAFGNGTYLPKTTDTMTYEYGEWKDNNTTYTLYVTPSNGSTYTLEYRGNAFITPEGHVIGGEGLSNAARVEKWEKTLATLPNTKWEATFKGEYVMDSVFRDSIYKHMSHGKIVYDTIWVFDHLDTVSADTTCYYTIEFAHNPATKATTGHYYQKSVRSTYDRATKQEEIISQKEREFDYNWYFSEVSSDSKFVIQLKGVAGGDSEKLNISKYKNDETTAEFLLNGLTFKPVVNP